MTTSGSSVVGFSDDPAASLIEPGLTTVAQPVDQIGREAARLLLNHLTDKATVPETVVLPTHLVVRGSRQFMSATMPPVEVTCPERTG